MTCDVSGLGPELSDMTCSGKYRDSVITVVGDCPFLHKNDVLCPLLLIYCSSTLKYTNRRTTQPPTPPLHRQNDVQRSTTRPRWPTIPASHKDLFPFREKSIYPRHPYFYRKRHSSFYNPIRYTFITYSIRCTGITPYFSYCIQPNRFPSGTFPATTGRIT